MCRSKIRAAISRQGPSFLYSNIELTLTPRAPCSHRPSCASSSFPLQTLSPCEEYPCIRLFPVHSFTPAKFGSLAKDCTWENRRFGSELTEPFSSSRSLGQLCWCGVLHTAHARLDTLVNHRCVYSIDPCTQHEVDYIPKIVHPSTPSQPQSNTCAKFPAYNPPIATEGRACGIWQPDTV